MYKEIKNQIEDKKVLEELISGLEDRIKFKIQNELGLHATSYSELKIECSAVDDRMAKVFSHIEKLDNRLQLIKKEYEIIENTINKVDCLLKDMKELHKKVFRCRYIWGLSVKETSKRLNYSTDYVKELTKEIWKK